MDANAHHCPFLNRSDERCGRHLSLDGLPHAFDHCFGHYLACPVYLERLVERRVRQVSSKLVPAPAAAEPGHAIANARVYHRLTIAGR
ncbi:MAG TPA: hypothetical protein VK324_14270 [Tepidisphaeraceae bacterium]|nr:hypothetical protein [Tepidisphaeraceae bacterium]